MFLPRGANTELIIGGSITVSLTLTGSTILSRRSLETAGVQVVDKLEHQGNLFPDDQRLPIEALKLFRSISASKIPVA